MRERERCHSFSLLRALEIENRFVRRKRKRKRKREKWKDRQETAALSAIASERATTATFLSILLWLVHRPLSETSFTDLFSQNWEEEKKTPVRSSSHLSLLSLPPNFYFTALAFFLSCTCKRIFKLSLLSRTVGREGKNGRPILFPNDFLVSRTCERASPRKKKKKTRNTFGGKN